MTAAVSLRECVSKDADDDGGRCAVCGVLVAMLVVVVVDFPADDSHNVERCDSRERDGMFGLLCVCAVVRGGFPTIRRTASPTAAEIQHEPCNPSARRRAHGRTDT